MFTRGLTILVRQRLSCIISTKLLLVMKFTFLFLTVCCLHVGAASFSQTITLDLKNESFKNVLEKISKQSGYTVFAKANDLKKAKNVTINVSKISLTEALDQLFANQQLSYQLMDKSILIVLKNEFLPPPSWVLNGQVINDKSEPLAGVSISLKGKSRGTFTDNDGRFMLEIDDASDSLVATFVGYSTKTVSVGTSRQMTIILIQDIERQKLEEVVTVAFGRQKRTEMVGSVTTVKPDDLRVPSSNLTTALAGQVAGMIAYQRSGEPGEDNADFFIRGITSFGSGKKDPLILIDGMELGVTELSRLRPDDIESFNIFKDATSTALYGARGANGVIYVVTKKGKIGKPVVAIRSEASYSEPTKNIEFADPVTFMKMYNEAVFARDPLGRADKYSSEKIFMTEQGKFPLIFPAIDWKEMLFKNSTVNHRHNMSVSGGGQVASYYVAGSFAQDNGMLKVPRENNFNNNIDLKSYTLRANVNVFLSKTSELIVRLNGNFDDYNGPLIGGSQAYARMVKSSPVDLVPFYPKDSAHSFVQHIMFGRASQQGAKVSSINPYADLTRGYRQYDRSLMMAQLEFKQDLAFILSGLRFRTMFNVNKISRYDITRQYVPFLYTIDSYDKVTGDYTLIANEGREYLDFAAGGRQQSSVYYYDAALDYSRSFKEKHNVSAMLVSIFRGSTSANASTLQDSLPYRNLGLSGRATYNYDSRYFLEFNFGYNGSERFAEDKRFGFFPSVGAAWSISNEKFWEPFYATVNNMRLRYTYGYVGNDQIGSANDRFFYMPEVNLDYAARSYVFGRDRTYPVTGVRVLRYANPDISWETSEKHNLGVEIGLFKKINILADFFREKRTNILLARSYLPTTMGLTPVDPVRSNIGVASGKGMDVSIDGMFRFGKEMWLQTRGNFTYAKSKYDVFEDPDYGANWWLTRVGYSNYQPRGYLAERLFVDDNEVLNSPLQFGTNVAGDIKYKDINKDGRITSLDQIPIGFPTVPEIIYGFGFSYGFKKIDISAFFQGSARSSFWIGNPPRNIQPFYEGNQVLKVIADDYYSLSNPNLYAFYPRLSNIDQTNNMQYSTWWLRDGAFMRLKQAEIGWTMPDKWVKSINFTKSRIYLSGSNLFLFSKFKLWDVEMGGNGLGYPLQRVFNAGINVNF